MIKNEEKIIKRCVDSALDILDGLCFCDTGSTDNTIDVCNDIIKTSGKPGKVYQEPFVDFGYNRSKSFNFALEFVKELGWDLTTTFGLLIDADMILKIEPTFEKSFISEYDHYKIAQMNGIQKYYNIRLIRMSEEWYCVGKTHECWALKRNIVNHKGAVLMDKQRIWIDDISDGGCKSDKYERDLRLLYSNVEENPVNNCRDFFYIAQTHFCLQNYEKSIEFYTKTIELSNWDEEKWLCRYMIAESYMFLDKIKNLDKIEDMCIQAYENYKIRSESLKLLVTIFIELKDYEKAWKYLNMGIVIPKPEKQILYMNDYIYKYGFLFDKVHLTYLQYPEKTLEIFTIFMFLINRSEKEHLLDFVSGIKLFGTATPMLNRIPFYCMETALDSVSLVYKNSEYTLLMNNKITTLDTAFNQTSHTLPLNTDKMVLISFNQDFYTCKKDDIYEYGKFENNSFTPNETLENLYPLIITENGVDFVKSLHPFKLKNNKSEKDTPKIFSIFNSVLPGVLYKNKIRILTFCNFEDENLFMFLNLNTLGEPESHSLPFRLEKGFNNICSFTFNEEKVFIVYFNNNILRLSSFVFPDEIKI